MRHISYKFLVLYIVLGAVIGSLIGEFAGFIIPDGVVKEFFLKSVEPGFDPVTLNLIVIQITLGLAFKFNISGLFGIFIAVYLLKSYR